MAVVPATAATAGLVSPATCPLLTFAKRTSRGQSNGVGQSRCRTKSPESCGNRVVTSQAVCEQHGNTVTWIANQPPDAVVYPQNTEEVQQIVRICAASGVAIIPFGVGTSLEGHVNAPVGGVSIDFRDMNRVLAVHGEDLDCIVEPGITRKA